MRNGHEIYHGEEMAIYVDGVFVSYVDNFQLRVDYNIEKVKIPRVKLTQHKVAGGEASGVIGGFLYNAALQAAAMSYLGNGKKRLISVTGSMRNLDTMEAGTVTASGIVFQSADLANWQVDAPVKIEQPFFASNVSIKGFQTPRA
ncbi:phage tail tube protein [Exiguobacterium sp. s183]|uniref:phage tail tube protein n=1 Tax=Exiguobacterium sp. s183 TaxID=2751262 RepID=UPI001BE7B162|nr:phage tail tube protein [Exiguobacterium sp. s183]